MYLNDILNKKLLIVSGKGGVGKSSVSAALAIILSGLERKCLVVEIGTEGKVSSLLGSGYAGWKEREIYPNVFFKSMLPNEAMNRYLVWHLKSKTLSALIRSNPAVKYFTATAPGFKELLYIGTVWFDASEGDRQGKATYDTVIFDAPSTGHCISLLKVPQTVKDMVKVGPIKSETQTILDFITDAKKTSLVVVSLPEEMPVNETKEMISKVKSQVGISTKCVFLNCMYPRPLEESHEETLARLQGDKSLMKEVGNILGNDFLHALLRSYASISARRELCEQYMNVLSSGLEIPVFEIPYIFSPLKKATDKMGGKSKKFGDGGLKQQSADPVRDFISNGTGTSLAGFTNNFDLSTIKIMAGHLKALIE